MNKLAVNAYDFVKDVANHHRKITAFQKIVAVTLVVGVSVVIHRNAWVLLLCLTYLLSLACAIFLTNHIIYKNIHVRSDLVLIFIEYFGSDLKNAFSTIRSIYIAIFYENSNSPQYMDEDQVPNNGNHNDHGLRSEKLSDGRQFENGQDFESDNLPHDSGSPNVGMSQSIFYLSCTEDEKESDDFYLQNQGSGMTQDELKSQVLDSEVGQRYIITDRQLHVERENSMPCVDNSVSSINSKLEVISLDSDNGPPCKNRDSEEQCFSELGKKIDDTVNTLLKLIHRDFVIAWYQILSCNTEAPDELYAAFESIAEQFKIRFIQIEYHSLAGEICSLFQNHLQVANAASQMLKSQSKKRHKTKSTPSSSQNTKIPVFDTLENCYEFKWSLHPALKNDTVETKYIRSVTGIMIKYCVPTNLQSSQTVQILFNEILTSNVFLNVVHRLCEPVFIFEKIVQIISDEEIFLRDESSLTSDIERDATHTEKIESQNNVENLLTKDKDSFSGYVHAENVPVKWNDETLPEFFLHSVEARKTICSDSTVVGSPEMEKNIARISNKDVEISGDVSLPEKICSKKQVVHGINLKDPKPSHENSLFVLVTETAKIRVDSSNVDSSALSSSSASTFSLSSGTVSLANDTEEVSVIKEIPLTLLRPSIKTSTWSEKEDSEWSQKASRVSLSQSTQCSDPVSVDEKSPSSFDLHNLPVDQADDVFETDLFDGKKENTEAFDQKTARRSSLSVRLTDLGETTQDVSSLHQTFHNILITATDIRKERGTSSSYTLYKVEYEAVYSDETGDLVPKNGMVWRRFREFVNLQVRLEDNSEYKKSLKDVKGPKRWQSLPFGNMDKDRVENRKKLLETYLKCLIAKPDICNGPELKEFLGYEGDGRIAFVRKPSDVGVRRIDQVLANLDLCNLLGAIIRTNNIDHALMAHYATADQGLCCFQLDLTHKKLKQIRGKDQEKMMLVRTVSGVFDKIVERLPSLPQELPSFSGKKEETKEDDNLPLDDVDCIEMDYSISERQTQSSNLSIEHILERFTELKGKKKPMTASQEGDTTLRKNGTIADTKQKVTDPKGTNFRSSISESETENSRAELPVATYVLDILVEILSSHDNWVCRERVQTAARLVLGKALNRWLEGKVDFLSSSEMVLFYLTTLQKTFWPEGEFVLEPRLKLTPCQEERIKFQAVNCLIHFFPGALVKLIGADDFEIAIEEALECLNHKNLNKHLWYCVIDLLIEKLFPEIKLEDFHRSAQEKTS